MASLVSGFDLDKIEYFTQCHGIPYITGASNVSDDGAIKIDRYTSENYVNSHIGDILLTCKGTIGKLAINSIGDCHVARQIMAINSFINAKYMFLVLSSYSHILSSRGRSQIPGIGRNDVLRLPMRVPPLKEQQRIVDKTITILTILDLVEKGSNEYCRLVNLVRMVILDMAIHGKLVPQDPSDEPASEFLERIGAKETAPISDDDKKYYGKLPTGWAFSTLGELGTWKAGSTPPKTNPSFFYGSTPWLKTGDLTNSVVESVPSTVSNEALGRFSLPINQKGNLLVAMYGATIGKIGIAAFSLTTNQACCGFTPKEKLMTPFLFYFLLSQKDRLIALGAGGAQPNISKEKIISFPIMVPPISEQAKIVKSIQKSFESICNHPEPDFNSLLF